jgi:hypothetical protein
MKKYKDKKIKSLGNNNENNFIFKIRNRWGFFAYIIKFHPCFFVLAPILIIVVIIGIILILNVSYDQTHGFRWHPAAKIEINKLK